MNYYLLLQNQLIPDSANVAKMQSLLTPDSLLQKAPSSVSDLKSFPWAEMLHGFVSQVVTFFFHLVMAVIVFYIGKFVINRLHSIFKVILQSRNVEASLASFLLSLLRITLMVFLIILVIGILGIETSSFIALFASAGVAVGMALSGALQNFAGGVLILLLKPFKVGDYIVYGEYKGFVREIQIFHTVITTYNNDRIVIPNGGLSTGVVENFSAEDYHRVEWKVSISYGASAGKVRDLILQILGEDKRVVAVPDEGSASLAVREPSVAVEGMGSSEVTLVVRAWVKTIDYWGVKYSVEEQLYDRLPKAGFDFPFPQLDVTIKK